jgi:hypothetical protein
MLAWRRWEHQAEPVSCTTEVQHPRSMTNSKRKLDLDAMDTE